MGNPSAGRLTRIGRKIGHLANEIDLYKLDAWMSPVVPPLFSTTAADVDSAARSRSSRTGTATPGATTAAYYSGHQQRAADAFLTESDASYQATPDLSSSNSSPAIHGASSTSPYASIQYYFDSFDHEKAEIARIKEDTKAIKARRLAIEAELRGTSLKVPDSVRKESYKLSERKRIATEKNVAEVAKTSFAEAKLAYKISAAAAKKIEDAQRWDEIKMQQAKLAAVKREEKAKYIRGGKLPPPPAPPAPADVHRSQVRNVMRANDIASSGLTPHEQQYARIYAAYLLQGGLRVPQFDELLAEHAYGGNADAAVLQRLENEHHAQMLQEQHASSQRKAQQYADDLAKLTLATPAVEVEVNSAGDLSQQRERASDSEVTREMDEKTDRSTPRSGKHPSASMHGTPASRRGRGGDSSPCC